VSVQTRTPPLASAEAVSGEPTQPKLLFAARRAPFPLVTGARIRTYQLLSGLAKRFDTTFVTFEHADGSPDGHVSREEMLRQLPGINVVCVPGCGPGKRFRQARTLLSRHSWEYGRYRLPAMRTTLEQLVASEQPQIVHFDDLAVAQFGPLPDVVNVYSSHNVEYRILEGTVRTSHGPRRFFAQLERRKVEPVERRVLQTMSFSLACSEIDAAEMRAAGGRVVVCPNGADPVDLLPTPERSNGEPLRLLFVGSVSYRPNQQGLAWFIEEVMPRLRATGTDVELEIVGAPARSLPEAPEVRVLGIVPALKPFYERAHAAIVPVLYGSGTRLKVVEAMAYGRPVVATAIGAEGLPVRAGSHYFQADDADTFNAALLVLAQQLEHDRAPLELMLARARAVVTPLFWPRIVSDLAECYRAEAPVALS
jgi:glycosyltransferase involved in cell wall biosynthesis